MPLISCLAHALDCAILTSFDETKAHFLGGYSVALCSVINGPSLVMSFLSTPVCFLSKLQLFKITDMGLLVGLEIACFVLETIANSTGGREKCKQECWLKMVVSGLVLTRAQSH